MSIVTGMCDLNRRDIPNGNKNTYFLENDPQIKYLHIQEGAGWCQSIEWSTVLIGKTKM